MGMFDMSYKDVEDGAIGVEGKKKKTLAPDAPAQTIPVAKPARAIAETGAAKPIDASRPWYAGTDSRDERTGLEMERARRGEATQAGVLNDPVKSAIQDGVVGTPAATVQQQQATEPVSIASLPAVSSPQQSYQPGSVMAKVAAGNDTYVQSKAGDPVAPVSVKPGFNKDGIITAESAQSAYANNATGNKGIMGNANVFGTMDMASANAVDQRANNVRQQMIDAQVGNGTGKPVSWQDQHGNADPEKQRIADSNALLNKWDKQYQNGQVMAEMGRNPRAAQGIAHLAAAAGHDETVMRGQEIAANNAASSDMTTRRGQDISAKNEAAKLAGNPQDQQLKQAQAQGIMAGLESDKMIDDIRKKAIAGDAQSLAVYQALTGKAKPATDRFMAVQGGEEVGLDGMTKIKKPSGVFDAQTGQFVPMGAGQQKAAAGKPSYEQFSVQMKQRHGDKATDAAMKQAYAKQFGA